jgi:hypothetical protein
MCLILPVSAERKEDTPLGKQMEATGHALKGFRKETDPATTPISPPSGPATGSCNGLHPGNNFLGSMFVLTICYLWVL